MIGILTFNRAVNYGAVLQAFALKESIKKYDDCEIINYLAPKIENSYKPFNRGIIKGMIYYLQYHKQYKKFHDFIQDISGSETINKIPAEEYKKIVVGSDQVWNYNCSGYDKTFLLEGVKSKKYAYAASFGVSTLPKEWEGDFKENLSNFHYISVREKTGQKICKEQLNLAAEVVLDPTLLLNKAEWGEKFSLTEKKKGYVLVYSLGQIKKLKAVAKKIAKQLNLPIYSVSTSAKDFFGDRVIKSAGPKEWVDLFYNASFIVTDSFHGTAFSVNFNKPFYSLATNERSSRIVDLLNALGLNNRLNVAIEQVDARKEIDYVSVNKKLHLEREKSFAFIEKIIHD